MKIKFVIPVLLLTAFIILSCNKSSAPSSPDTAQTTATAVQTHTATQNITSYETPVFTETATVTVTLTVTSTITSTATVTPTVTNVPDCDDSIPCTTDYYDTSLGQCVHIPVHSYCNDGDSTTIDRCDPANTLADPMTGCTNTFDPSACDDGNPCTINDTLTGGVCAGIPAVCTDNDPLTTDTCNPITGECEHQY